MNRKKILKIIAAVVALALLAMILLLANGLLGNPISKAMVAYTAKNYVVKTYPELELELSKPFYNFKTGGYSVTAQSPTSIDTHFTLSLDAWGKLVYDRYEYSVLGLDNTLRRVDALYNKQVDEVLEAKTFPYPIYISYGELHNISAEKLELDKEYDIGELGRTDGHIVAYIEDETVSAQRTAEILLDMKQILDKAGVGFVSIDFELIKPRIDDLPNPDDSRFGVANFPYADIYQEGLLSRLTDAAEALDSYYAQQDALKDGEIAQIDPS